MEYVGPEPVPPPPNPLHELEQVFPPSAGEALVLLRAFYEQTIGSELPAIHVTFVRERIPFGDTTVIGLHYGCGDIWVTWWPELGTDLHDTALAHEVAHCARLTAEGSGDGAHADDLWWARPGGIAEDGREVLRAAAL